MGKRPTLEEVKAYFKDAKEIESMYGTKADFSDKDLSTIYETMDSFFVAIKETFLHCCLWHQDTGYAKILTYKVENDKVQFIKESNEKFRKVHYDGIQEHCRKLSEYYSSEIAEIKTEKFEITRLQIDELCEISSIVHEYLKAVLPKAFEVKVDYNEPILSLNDLLSVWGISDNVELYKTSPMFKNFERLAEEKQNKL